jgi:uncharacterized protein YjbI with pentapeptide repeats
MKDKRIFSLLKLLIGLLIALALIVYIYDKYVSTIKYSIFGESSFYTGLITNMFNSVIDFFIFTIILFIILGKHEKKDKIQLYKENIDDCRFWYSDEAAFKIAGNIRRLQELGITTYDLSKVSLSKTKLKETIFKSSRFMGSTLISTNLDNSTFDKCNFQGAFLNESSLNITVSKNCVYRYLRFNNAQMKSSKVSNSDFTNSMLCNSNFYATIFTDCIFEKADLTECNFERADVRKVKGLEVKQLLRCKSLKYTKMDEDLKKQLVSQKPELFR